MENNLLETKETYKQRMIAYLYEIAIAEQRKIMLENEIKSVRNKIKEMNDKEKRSEQSLHQTKDQQDALVKEKTSCENEVFTEEKTLSLLGLIVCSIIVCGILSVIFFVICFIVSIISELLDVNFFFFFLPIKALYDFYSDLVPSFAQSHFIIFEVVAVPFTTCYVPSLLLVLADEGVDRREQSQKRHEWEEEKKKRIMDKEDRIKRMEYEIGHYEEEKRLFIKQIADLNSYESKYYEPLNETQKTLDEYYSLNVIYPKYRDIDSVTRFIEYFQAGRCVDFEGPFGAYNLLELEKRLDKIIDNLVKINERLEFISSQLHTVISTESTIRRGFDVISENLREQISISQQMFTSQNYSMNVLNSQINEIGKLNRIQVEQSKRFYDYQNLVKRRERLEQGHWDMP